MRRGPGPVDDPSRVRELTAREREVLIAMIERGMDHEGRPTAADRERWLVSVPGVRAGSRCGCRTCPSIELTDARGLRQPEHAVRIVLEAGTKDGLLLFVDDDRLSYLELAPFDDEGVAEFPSAESIDIG
ncbi:hypothetical protein JL107_12060 [Nakamurella flavida]|uniref:Uncharacterized protein n=1 Tax=Nakamurella flavida TaxID=363630 RepID=A0A938YPU9_9ACTN|nr:hypothetical protein [Nakamurella flavida]MBM9477184.1 hypothetical protein [Nakamurella flavida]MDP9780133.1 hypothetical protein [Nakamurella flavida]